MISLCFLQNAKFKKNTTLENSVWILNVFIWIILSYMSYFYDWEFVNTWNEWNDVYR